MSNVIETPAPATPAATRYSADAAERMLRLRQMAADFPAETDPRPLTKSEMSIASQTSVTAMEKAAVFADAVPRISDGVIDVEETRDAASFELAYGGVRDEARALARRIELAILRKKLGPAIATRNLYGVGKIMARNDAMIRTHVADMKRALVSPRRKKLGAQPTEAVEPTAAATKP